MQFVHELTPEGASRPESDAAAALSAVATPALLGLPDDLFLFAAELGRAHVAGFHADLSGGIDPTYPEYQARLSELFLANGIPYELDEDGRFVATGSPTVFATSVGPAMDALDEPRLATARMHLIEAQRRLQEPDQEEAVDEARQAVEAAMIAVLDACGIPVPEKRQPDELFNALAPKDPDQPRAMSRDALELVLATPRFRGRTAAGHAGGPAVTLGEAQAAVAAASAAILYLADKLPE
jgi:HEPN domain-containing protein